MPTARGADEVQRAVTSVLRQDHEDFELLIGDDTGAVAELAAHIDDPRVLYRRNPRRLGFAGNHIALLDRARGRYLAVLHDDDHWDPAYLSTMVSAFDAHPDVGLVCCRTAVDRGSTGRGGELWPLPLAAGTVHDWLGTLLRHEWFMLLCSTMWRRAVWAGPARHWPDVRCGDLQLFLSAAEAGWDLYVLHDVLASYSQHHGQSGAWRGADNGLGVADDVLAFWDGWLEGRPPGQIALTARPRARWHLRRARALLLCGRRDEARAAVTEAERLAGADLPDLRRLRFASRLPNSLVRGAVGLKRMAGELSLPRPGVSGRPRRGTT